MLNQILKKQPGQIYSNNLWTNAKIIKLGMLVFFMMIHLKCSSSLTQDKPEHHAPDGGFQNLDKDAQPHGLSGVVAWQVSNWFKKLPSVNPKDYQFSIVSNDGSKLKENKNKFSITWIGHATTLVQLDGLNILTDPIWSERCSPVSFAGPKRFTNPGIAMDDLPQIDLVIISHNHYDHMDLPTLLELDKRFKPLFITGLGNKKFLISEGLQNVEELDWWQEISHKGLKLTFTPTQHFSARGLFDRNKTLWGSYIVQGKKNTFYFAGDTAYFKDFQRIGEKFPNIDVAILPIGAYEPRWFMKVVHMNPNDSANAFADLKAKKFVPMHYQTFVLTDEALDEPLQLIEKEFKERNWNRENLLDLKIGETKVLD